MIKRAITLRNRRKVKRDDQANVKRALVADAPSRTRVLLALSTIAMLAIVTVWSFGSFSDKEGFLSPNWYYWKSTHPRICETSHEASFCASSSDGSSLTCRKHRFSGVVSCEMTDAVLLSPVPSLETKGMLLNGAMRIRECQRTNVPLPKEDKVSGIIRRMVDHKPYSGCSSVGDRQKVLVVVDASNMNTNRCNTLGTSNSIVNYIFTIKSALSAAHSSDLHRSKLLGTNSKAPVVIVLSGIDKISSECLEIWKWSSKRILSSTDIVLETSLERGNLCWASAVIFPRGLESFSTNPIWYQTTTMRRQKGKNACIYGSPAAKALANGLAGTGTGVSQGDEQASFREYLKADAFAGTDYRVEDGRDLEKCKKSCREDTSCTGFCRYMEMCYFRKQRSLENNIKLTEGASLYIIERKPKIPRVIAISDGLNMKTIGDSLGSKVELVSITSTEISLPLLAERLRYGKALVVSSSVLTSNFPSIVLLMPPCTSVLQIISSSTSLLSIPIRPDIKLLTTSNDHHDQVETLSRLLNTVQKPIGDCPKFPKLATESTRILPSFPSEVPGASKANAIAAGVSSGVADFVAGKKYSGTSHRLGVIVPFRDSKDKTSQGADRTKNLKEFVPFMSSFLKNAGVDFEIVVAEQTEGHIFNKGALFNVGFLLVRERVDYVVLHDVDQVPENPKNTYAYPDRPTHLCSASSQWNYRPSYGQMVGGAIIMRNEHYEEVNGFSNSYFGWGQEDDDFYFRLNHAGYMRGGNDRLNPTVGRYKALAHKRVKDLDVTPMFKRQRKHLETTMKDKNRQKDGLSTVSYDLIGDPNTNDPSGCTRYLVQLKLPWMPKSLQDIPPPDL